MLKKISLLLAIGVIGVLGLSTPAAAKTRYTMVDHSTYVQPQNYHNRDTRTHYLWSWNHGAKLHNLRNYPHTTWKVTQTALLKHGRKAARYYYVVSANGRTSGWVWHGFVTAGTARKRAAASVDGVYFTSKSYYAGTGRYSNAQLEGVVTQRLHDDGFAVNNDLAMVNDYNWSNQLSPTPSQLAQSIQALHRKRLTPANVGVVTATPADLAHWIDPQHGNEQLEVTGQGQLASHLVSWVEQQLTAHHATQYSLYDGFSGEISQNTLHVQLILYYLK